MALVPGIKKKPVFTQVLRGSFGRFSTASSFRLDYLMASVPINSIEALETASELFNLREITFDALIQRDIDYGRVHRIANDYLSKSKGRVVFFPPLLACVVLLNKDGTLQGQYESIEGFLRNEGTDEAEYVRQWDTDGFELSLPCGTADTTERVIQSEDGSPLHFFDFAASLNLNPRRAKLVVLDGQHRLEAMKLLWRNEEQRDILQGLEIPICIVWAPDAKKDNAGDENVIRDFRELFVRVNHESRRVSGHFITLLKDDSYSAMAVRKFSDYWKNLTIPGDWSRLHLLEWNQRDDSKIDQRTRPFSITTISIIFRVFEDHLFRSGAIELLDLESRIGESDVTDAAALSHDIGDEPQNARIATIVSEQIEKHIVPGLDILFRTPSPYRRLEDQFGHAFSQLQRKVNESIPSFLGLKRYYSRYVYRDEEIFEETVRAANADFKSWIKVDDEDKSFFYQVFQQALLRLWIGVASNLNTLGISSTMAARSLVAGLEVGCFQTDPPYLGSRQRYTYRLLWRNETVNQGTQAARTAWFQLLSAALCRSEVREAMFDEIRGTEGVEDLDMEEVDRRLEAFGRQASQEYISLFRAEILKETEKNLEDFFNEDRARALSVLKASGNKEDREKFKKEVREKAEERVKSAIDDLANALSVDSLSLAV
jgi:hypothetical protein